MTGFRKRLAQGLVATILICALGVMAVGWVSTRGDAGNASAWSSCS